MLSRFKLLAPKLVRTFFLWGVYNVSVGLYPDITFHTSTVTFSFVLLWTSAANSLSGPQYTPDFALLKLSSAWKVLPLLVGPEWKMIFLLISLASLYLLTIAAKLH